MLDFLEKATLNLSLLDHVVQDEVDQMLDMGFSESVEKILKFAYKEGKFLLNCLTFKYQMSHIVFHSKLDHGYTL